MEWRNFVFRSGSFFFTSLFAPLPASLPASIHHPATSSALISLSLRSIPLLCSFVPFCILAHLRFKQQYKQARQKKVDLLRSDSLIIINFNNLVMPFKTDWKRLDQHQIWESKSLLHYSYIKWMFHKVKKIFTIFLLEERNIIYWTESNFRKY